MSSYVQEYSRYHQIQKLDPVKDHCQICQLMAGYEFPWDITRSLELALIKTFCIPSISQLLDKTGEFYYHTQKRYDDTALLIAEILKWGYASERGKESIKRINAIHGRYRIGNEDFLYVLSTFIYEPIRWNKRFGWRLMSEREKQACFYFWQAVGEKMNIKSIPANYVDFEAYNQEYEQKNFIYSDTNRQVGEATIHLFLSWFPSLIRPFLKPHVYCLFEERMLIAFGFPSPSFYQKALVNNILKLKGYLQKFLYPRQNPHFYTDTKIKSYPQGYQLTDLGPPQMLKSLNKKNN